MTFVFKGLNRLVRFAERTNLVSAGVPSHFKRALPVVTQHVTARVVPRVTGVCTVQTVRRSAGSRRVTSNGRSSLLLAPSIAVQFITPNEVNISSVALFYDYSNYPQYFILHITAFGKT